MRYILSIFLVLIISFSFGQHLNIRVDNPNVTSNPNEPSIMMNPSNPDRIIAGSNLNYYYISEDGGYNWESHTLTSSSYGVWGDPCIVADTEGSFYYMHLSNPPSGSWIDRIVCQKTTDLGETWNEGSYAGLNGTKAQDKEWATIDRSNDNIYMTWTQFDEYGSSNSADSTVIMFSKSTDGGASWYDAKRINKTAGNCVDSDNTVEGAVPAVGPEGQIYVAWTGPEGIVFDKSLDQGETWLDNDIQISEQPGGWDQEVSGISRCNGLPVTCCDTSGGIYDGNIYVNWTDQRNGEDDIDVFLAKSADGGETWSEPVRVNDDPPGSQQFFTWMTVDQTNGNLWFVFYDRRNYDNRNTDVYMAVSEDGGEAFTNFKVSEEPFYPSSSIFFGDYTNIVAHNDIIRPIWARLDSEQSIMTAIVDITAVGVEQPAFPLAINAAYPNPFNTSITVAFEQKGKSRVNISLHTLQGQRVAVLADRFFDPGEHVERFDPSKYNLAEGVYYLKLVNAFDVSIKKLIYRR